MKKKEFTPRSLVGMTMGARKRAARVECVKHPFKVRRLKLLWFKCFCRDAARRQETEQDRKCLALYVELRAKYRIGQRLRPCPGKHGCRNCTRICGACEDQCPNDTRCPRCGSVMTTEGPFCDGSGVLPAGAGR